MNNNKNILLTTSYFNIFRNRFSTNTILMIRNLYSYLSRYLDYIIFGLVLSFLIFDIIRNILFLLDNFSVYNYSDSITHMSNPGSGYPGSGYPGSGYPNNPASNPAAYSTQVTIIHDDGSWSNAIRSLFVYGSGGLRLFLNVSKGGTPGGRAFVIGTTIAADSVTKVLNNTINDPNYVREHYNSWRSIWDQATPDRVTVGVDPETENRLQNAVNSDIPNSAPNNLGNNAGYGRGNGSGTTNNLIGDNNDIESFSNSIVKNIMDYIKDIFEPVQVNYSNEILSNQIHDISILLFILTIFIFVLFLSLLFNLIIFLFSDRLINYFTNKYIKWYIIFNKKIIGVELVILSCWILYLMYTVSYGIHFIATHPIIFT